MGTLSQIFPQCHPERGLIFAPLSAEINRSRRIPASRGESRVSQGILTMRWFWELADLKSAEA